MCRMVNRQSMNVTVREWAGAIACTREWLGAVERGGITPAKDYFAGLRRRYRIHPT